MLLLPPSLPPYLPPSLHPSLPPSLPPQVFRGQHFHSVASLCADVPVLTCGGISKRFMVPGWRLGWILVHNRRNAFTKEVGGACHPGHTPCRIFVTRLILAPPPQVIPGLQQLAQKLLGPCTLIQTALPDILTRVPDSYHQRNLDLFETSARLCYERLSPIPGLTPIMPAGAMYMMVCVCLILILLSTAVLNCTWSFQQPRLLSSPAPLSSPTPLSSPAPPSGDAGSTALSRVP